jgi:hypothetical protein
MSSISYLVRFFLAFVPGSDPATSSCVLWLHLYFDLPGLAACRNESRNNFPTTDTFSNLASVCQCYPSVFSLFA